MKLSRDGEGYASNTPVADADRVYCFFGKSGVFAFDHSGKELWKADVGDGLKSWSSSASPVLHGDLVIVNASMESDSVVALDKKTGKEKWRAKGIREAWNTPLVVKSQEGKDELVIAAARKMFTFDPTTGEALWNCDTDITWYMVPSVVAHDGVVYCIGGRSGIIGLAVRAGGKGDVTKTHRLWTSKKGGTSLRRSTTMATSTDERRERHRILREGRDRRGGLRGARPARGRRVRVGPAGRWAHLRVGREARLRDRRQAEV